MHVCHRGITTGKIRLRLQRIKATQIYEHITATLYVLVLHRREPQIGFTYIWNLCLHMKKISYLYLFT